MIVGCLYLPNGNPAPGPKFDYKLRWFDWLAEHAGSLLTSGTPVVLAGDYNVMPTDLDVYAPERWIDDALFRPEVREAYRRLVGQGWTQLAEGSAPGRADLHVLEILPECLRSRRGSAHRSSAAQSTLGEASISAGVDREVRGREHASDHAPAWIELAEPTKALPGRARRARSLT